MSNWNGTDRRILCSFSRSFFRALMYYLLAGKTSILNVLVFHTVFFFLLPPSEALTRFNWLYLLFRNLITFLNTVYFMVALKKLSLSYYHAWAFKIQCVNKHIHLLDNNPFDCNWITGQCKGASESSPKPLLGITFMISVLNYAQNVYKKLKAYQEEFCKLHSFRSKTFQFVSAEGSEEAASGECHGLEGGVIAVYGPQRKASQEAFISTQDCWFHSNLTLWGRHLAEYQSVLIRVL